MDYQAQSPICEIDLLDAKGCLNFDNFFCEIGAAIMFNIGKYHFQTGFPHSSELSVQANQYAMACRHREASRQL